MSQDVLINVNIIEPNTIQVILDNSNATGSIKLSIDDKYYFEEPINNGVCNFLVDKTKVKSGKHSLTIEYSGDNNYSAKKITKTINFAINVFSEIINNKKQLILKVDQTSDFVYPNEPYKYQIYCKNVSGDVIENVHIQVLNPSTIAINEDDAIPPEGIEIGDLNNGQSHLLYLPARCSASGEFTVHFLCYGEESELVTKKLTILSNYDLYNDQTIHKIHIYNFTPYEEKYELHSEDYNNDVTQLIKKQKLPYQAKQSPFKMISSDLNNNIIIDESQNYIDQNNILYNKDEHNYQYLDRENFNKESVESFEGQNLKEIFDNINKYSKLFRATFLKTGSNQLLNDFKQYNPDGFIYRFGLMNSEIFHHIGVIPEYTYMNDYLFRWASEGKTPLNLYPKRVDMNWDANKWIGHGWNVWKTYTDEYKEQIINNIDYKPLFEFIHTFENLTTAEKYIKNEYEYDISNEYYINTEDGLEKIRKYQYIIKENYFDNGVFFVNIPLSKIPSNFFLLDTDEIEAIIEKTKPYGMKALIRYVISTQFNINMSFKAYTELHPQIQLDFGESMPITYSMTPYQYHNIIETICYKDNNDTPIYENRNALKMIPSGTGYYNSLRLNISPQIHFLDPDPTSVSMIDIAPEINNQMYGCNTVANLSYLAQIQDLLYQGNFDDISFYINNIPLHNILATDNEINFDTISAVNYKLWKDVLYYNKQKNIDPHSHWWDIHKEKKERGNEYDYYLTATDNKNIGKIDFVEIPLMNLQLTQEGVESGIGFEDITGKLHGISAEYNNDLNSFIIKYSTSLNNNFKIQKQGLANITGLAYKFTYTGNNTLIVFFIKQNDNNKIKYHYFDHVIVNEIKSIFCFTRTDKDITTIKKWSNLIKIGKNTNPKIIFNTPQYNNFKIYDPPIIIDKDLSNWQNISRIDKNEHSYSIAQNLSINELDIDNINLHFDNINIPDDSVVKSIKIKSILESNSYKTIYPSIRIQDGFITDLSDKNNIAMYPSDIECYPYYNNNTQYYEDQYNNAVINDVTKSIKLFNNKINENILFNESLGYTVDYLDDIEEYITVKKPFWIEISDFSDYNISMNNVNEIKFCIEGYNSGKEIYLHSQLRQDNTLSERTKTLIPSGYFKTYIPLKFYNKFSLDSVQLRFRFVGLNADLDIFDTYLDVEFKNKQNENKEFVDRDSVDIQKKKQINIEFIDHDIPGYLLKNGITTRLEFDNLDSGEYYRIYSIELEIIYQKQNIDLLISSNAQKIDINNPLTVVNGQASNNYMCGMFFNELIMPGTYQSQSTLNSENQGIELEDALYQSFTATTNNITSFTIYPNGFVGNPDVNLKIGLYDNKGNTPNKLIKEIRVNGWSKENPRLKNETMITYDFNVNNLNIGNKYWLKLEVDNVAENNYYLLKYNDTMVNNLKLLSRVNNNFINTFGSLKFHINTLNSFRSFNSLPLSEDREDFSDPKIFISLNKRIGEIQKIKVQKVASDTNDN